MSNSRLVACWAAAMMCCWGVLAAQAEGLKIEVEAALGGFYRPERWTPVFVNLSNQPGTGQSLNDVSDFAGQLVVVSEPLEGDGDVRFVREVDVPRASSKRYAMYAHIAEPGSPNAPPPQLILTEPNGRMIRSVPLPITPLRKTDVLVVNVGDSTAPPAFPRLRDQFDRTIFSQLAVESMPDLWTGYDAADMVVLQKWPDRGVPPQARQALMDWVNMGGTLVLLTGGNEASYADETARALLPVEIDKTGLLVEGTDGRFSVEPPGGSAQGRRGAYVLALGRPKSGTESILSVDGFPIFASRKMGNGRVIYSGLDLGSQSVGLEKFIGPAWFSLTPVRSLGKPDYELPRTLYNDLRILVGGAGQTPNPLVMILICVAYAITVGPINFLVLYRMKRLEWAWFTLPAIVLAFFVLIYGVGRVMKGNTQMVRELVVERYTAGSPDGASLTATSTFVSAAGRHSIVPSADRSALEFPYRWHENDPWREEPSFSAVAAALSQDAGSGTAPVVGPGESAQREVLGVRTMEMGTYDAKLFLTRGPALLGGGTVDADLQWVNPSIVGRITNKTDRAFSETYLLMGDSFMEVGAMAPGGSFELLQSDAVRGYPVAMRRTGQTRWLPEDALYTTLRGNESDDSTVDKYNAAVLLDALMRPDKSGTMFRPEGGKLFLLGISASDTPRTFTTVAVRAESRLVLTLVELDYRLDPSDVIPVPTRLVTLGAAGYAVDQTGALFMNGANELLLRSARMFMTVELPFHEPGVQVESVNLGLNPTTMQQQDWRVSALIPGPGGGWVDVPGNGPLPGKGLVMPGNGRIFLRLESQKNDKDNSMGSWQDGTRFPPFQIEYRLTVRPESTKQ